MVKKSEKKKKTLAKPIMTKHKGPRTLHERHYFHTHELNRLQGTTEEGGGPGIQDDGGGANEGASKARTKS